MILGWLIGIVKSVVSIAIGFIRDTIIEFSISSMLNRE